MSLFDRDHMALAIYAAAFGAEHVRATAAGDSRPHERAVNAAGAAKSAYLRVMEEADRTTEKLKTMMK